MLYVKYLLDLIVTQSIKFTFKNKIMSSIFKTSKFSKITNLTPLLTFLNFKIFPLSQVSYFLIIITNDK